MIKTAYNPNTGEVGMDWSCSDGSVFELNTNPDREFWDDLLDRKTQFIDVSTIPMTVKNRPEQVITQDKTTIAADGSDAIAISGLPDGDTKVTIYGPISTSWVENRGDITLTVNIPGEYRVRFEHFPYIEKQVTFNAT